MAIEGILRTGFEAQSSQTDAVKPLIFWESPHPLSVVRVGEVLPRDHNSALEILARAGWGPGAGNPGVRGAASAALGAGSDLKHGVDKAAGPRRSGVDARSPPSILRTRRKSSGRFSHGSKT